jgi:hypothetical protein
MIRTDSGTSLLVHKAMDNISSGLPVSDEIIDS